MVIHYWPYPLEAEDAPGSVHGFIDGLAKDEPVLFALVAQTLTTLGRDGNDLDSILQSWSERMKTKSCPLWELRIPPKRTGGVVRLYFCFDPDNHGGIVILDGEVKKNNNAKPQHEARAKSRCKVVRNGH